MVDLAYFDEDGLFYLVGRSSRFVKLFGLRLSLDDIEAFVRTKHPESAVLGDDSRILVALAGENVDVASMQLMLSTKYALPPTVIEVRSVPHIPRLPNGKTDYRRLDSRDRTAAKPRGLLEVFASEFWGILSGTSQRQESVLAAFRTVLGGRIENDEDSFRSIGGDSLKMIQLQLLLEDYVVDLPSDWPDLSIRRLEGLARQSSL